MRTVYIIISIVSLIFVSGCSQKGYELPSINEHRQMQIIQVAALFDPNTRRDHPYFIFCDQSDCPATTKKTPIRKVSLVNHQQGSAISQSVKDEGNHPYPTAPHVDADTDQANNSKTDLTKYRVHFDYASAELSRRNRKVLSLFVNNHDSAQPMIRVTGFTDSTVLDTGTIPNEWLALERAVSVKKYLISLGYPESRILLEARYLCCYIASNETERGRQINRRVGLTLIN